MGEIRLTGPAKRILKSYRHSADYAYLQTAVRKLEEAPDPERLGTFKTLNDLRCFAYNVTDSLRLLYAVDRSQVNRIIIYIHFLEDHKKSSSRD